MKTPIDSYREEIRDAIRLRDGKPVFNGSLDHAASISQEAFNNARDCVRILTYKLDPNCYTPEVKNAAKFFLTNPAHRLEILVETSLWDNNRQFNWREHPFLRELSQFSNSDNPQLVVRRVPASWAGRYTFNFLLLDNYGYRYEADRSVTAAIAAFLPPGQESKMIGMERFFDSLWNDPQAEIIVLN